MMPFNVAIPPPPPVHPPSATESPTEPATDPAKSANREQGGSAIYRLSWLKENQDGANYTKLSKPLKESKNL